MKNKIAFRHRFHVYASKERGEHGMYCRVTYCRKLSLTDNEFLYGMLSLANKADIDILIKTAREEQFHHPLIISLLEELKAKGECVTYTSTAEIILGNLYSSAISQNFPSFSPIIPFRFKWFAKNGNIERMPVSITVDF